ncbi:uncharacterized protein EV422DRAFT_509750 [Fimicolochytrium jonesii]|uniref:uncharacterized protein n=1 Tax=Fimicolochytrium jonesii TaxID=1396493 RepID=UPI0022FED22B|nr:uncharacterized protein EV422DRAFT_509750 [Fimicolochytrium jonesii]KAI8816514.1 hypothetical protein EV422DRAFT_509750 [Fimicolochytrium jonesii]
MYSILSSVGSYLTGQVESGELDYNEERGARKLRRASLSAVPKEDGDNSDEDDAASSDEDYSDVDASILDLEALSQDELLKVTLDEGNDWRTPAPPARPELTAMAPLYLSAALNKRVEALRHDVLRGRLIEMTLAREYYSSYGANADTLTAAPLLGYDGSTAALAIAPVISDDYPGSPVLPPLTRALYVRLLRSLPIFAGRGPKYMVDFDRFIDEDFLDFVGKWMRASRFDILSFTSHYVTLFSHLKNEAWYGADDTPLPLPLGFEAPAMLPTTMYPDLLTFHRASLPGGGSFRLHKRHRAEGGDSDAVISLRESKAKAFTEAWRKVLSTGCNVCRDMIGRGPASKDVVLTKFWSTVKAAPNVADLPPSWQAFIYGLCTAMAHTIDNVLDDAEWRAKFVSIWKRIPVTIMLTSLRLVNPIPFVDRVIKLFCWKPPGMYSLLQRIGGMICAADKTAATLKRLAREVDTPTRTAVEKAVDTAFTSSTSSTTHIRPISSQAPAHKILSFLQESPDFTITPIGTATLSYTKAYIRKREKDEFVEVLGSKNVTDFLTHFAKAVPPMLDEIWNCIDFANLMSKLVDTVNQIITALSLYDTAAESNKDTVHLDVTRALYAALLPFLKAAYPLMHALAHKERTGDAGLHALVEYIVMEINLPDPDGIAASPDLSTSRNKSSAKKTAQKSVKSTRAPILTVAKDASPVLLHLSPADTTQLLHNEVDEIIACLESGTDPREFPSHVDSSADDVLTSKAFPVFWHAIVAEFVGGENIVSPPPSPEASRKGAAAASHTGTPNLNATHVTQLTPGFASKRFANGATATPPPVANVTDDVD